MTTRAAAVAAAGETLAAAEMSLFDGSVADAARRAWTPTGPSIEELEERIREHRAAVFRSSGAHPAGERSG